MTRPPSHWASRLGVDRLASIFQPRPSPAMRPDMTNGDVKEETAAEPPADQDDSLETTASAEAPSAGEVPLAGEASASQDAAQPQTAEADAEALAREAERIEALFTGAAPEARFRFARWAKPIAPAFLGLSADSVETMRGGFETVAALAGAPIAEEDPELGANILICLTESWSDLAAAPGLAAVIPDLAELLGQLEAAGLGQYRRVAFEPDGSLRFIAVLLRYDEGLARLSAGSLALGLAVQALLCWPDEAFASESPVTVRRGGKALVKSRFARLLKAAYAEETPVASDDPALATALAERIQAEAPRRRDDAGEAPLENGEDDAEESGAESGEEAGGTGEAEERAPRSRRQRRRRGPPPSDDPLGGDPRPEEPEDAADGEEEES